VVKFSDPILMREINKYRVLEAIRVAGQISRVEISKGTMLSATTVSTITGALIEEGLIKATHTVPPAGAPRGRPRVLLGLIPDAAYVVGIMITEKLTTTTISDFRGEPVCSIQLPLRMGRWTPDVVVDVIEDGIEECIATGNINAALVKGVGIGIPGLLTSGSGADHSSTVFSGRAMPIASMLEARIKLPVTLENPASLITMAETWFGQTRGDESLVVVTLGDSLGMSYFFGANSAPGMTPISSPVGHVKVPGNGVVCECGQIDCLYSYVSKTANIDAARTILGAEKFSDRVSGAQCISALCDAASAGNEAAQAFLRMQGEKLGFAASHIINLLGPSKLVIGVEDPVYRDQIAAPLLKCISENSFKPLIETTEIVLHTFDEHLWARGAAALVLRDIYSAPWS